MNLNFHHLLICLFAIVCALPSCRVLEEITEFAPEVCNEIPSTRYLVRADTANFSPIEARSLLNPVNHMVDVCSIHFPANQRSGMEYNKAVDEINKIVGSTLHFTTRRTAVFHWDQTNANSIADSTQSRFDYVEMNQARASVCGVNGGDQIFALRACRHTLENGMTKHFSILAHAPGYAHFADSSSSDHPYHHGIMHELAHIFGMNHTPGWDMKDRKLISTMQGNLNRLSALDVHVLRRKYPDTSAPNHVNFVASNKIKTDSAFGRFSRLNPVQFYFDSDGNLKQCSTQEDPALRLAWFNTGNIATDSNVCIANKVSLKNRINPAEEIILKIWKIANMPAVSQDQWIGQVQVQVPDFQNLNFNQAWDLVFETNIWGHTEHTRDDNIEKFQVEIFSQPCP